MSNWIKKNVIPSLPRNLARDQAARMTPARFLGKLGMTFFLVHYSYLCATAYYNPAKYKTYLEQLGIAYPTVRPATPKASGVE